MLIKGKLHFTMNQFNPDKLDEIEEALLRGEKYEEMWKTFKNNYYYYLVGIKNQQENWTIGNFINITEDKYFPKPKEINWKEKFDELEEEFEEREAELIKEIEYQRFRNYSGREHKL